MAVSALQEMLAQVENETERMKTEARKKIARIRFELQVQQALTAKLRDAMTQTYTRRASNKDDSLADLAIAVLVREQRPMSVGEIAEELEKMGVETTSPRGLQPMIVSAMTRRKDKVKRQGRGIYAVQGEPVMA